MLAILPSLSNPSRELKRTRRKTRVVLHVLVLSVVRKEEMINPTHLNGIACRHLQGIGMRERLMEKNICGSICATAKHFGNALITAGKCAGSYARTDTSTADLCYTYFVI